MIRDSTNRWLYVWNCLVLLEDLNELLHLTSLRDKEIEILASNPGTASHTQLLNESKLLN